MPPQQQNNASIGTTLFVYLINLDAIIAIDISRIRNKMTPSWSNNERLGGCSL